MSDEKINCSAESLKAEFDRNLKAMSDVKLSNRDFLKLSERNMKIQNELIKRKQS